jgi:hypothetical protein
MDQLFEVSIAAVLVAGSIATAFFGQRTAAEDIPGCYFVLALSCVCCLSERVLLY